MGLTLSKSRIEALSDGVFSIAMTLLVLKLEVPDVMHIHSNEAMTQELIALEPAFATYVITFLIAGRFWYLHHLTFHFIRNVDGFLLGINLVFLMLVSLLPFSAGLITHLFTHPVSQLFYYGNQLALALLLNLHWRYAMRKDFTSDADPVERSRLGFRVGLMAAIFAACFITSIFSPRYSWLPGILLAAIGRLMDLKRRRRRRSKSL